MGRIVGTGLTVLAPVSVLAPPRAAAQTAAGLSGPPSAWSLGLNVSGSWYENPRFVGGNRPSSWSTTARASLSHARRFQTGTFTLSGHAGYLYYPELDQLRQGTYGGAAALGWAASRSTQLSLSQTYSRSNTRQLDDLLDEEDLPVPTTGVHTASSRLGLTQRLSQRMLLEASGGFTWRRYDSPTIVGGEHLQAGVGLARAVGRDGAVFVRYGLSQSWYTDRVGRAHVGTLGVRSRPARGVSFELAGGVAYLESVEQFHPAGLAQIGVSGRKVSASVRYHRDFGLAFGYGRETIADRVSARLGWAPARRLSFHVGYGYGYRRDPTDEVFRVHSHVATAGLNWGVTGGLSFAASYSREQSRAEGFREVKGSRATASLSYGIGWR